MAGPVFARVPPTRSPSPSRRSPGEDHLTTDGRLYELVDENGEVIHVVTLDDLVNSWEASAGAAHAT
jgi:hypothetical protein